MNMSCVCSKDMYWTVSPGQKNSSFVFKILITTYTINRFSGESKEFALTIKLRIKDSYESNYRKHIQKKMYRYGRYSHRHLA